MEITDRTQYIQETNQETFTKSGDFLGTEGFTVKIANVRFSDREDRYFTIVFENDEDRQYKYNQFVPPLQQDYQERQYVESLSRLGIRLNLPDLTFNTDQLTGKIGTIVPKDKFNEGQGKYFIKLSYVKAWNKDDEIVDKPEPETDKMKQKEQRANRKQTPMSQQSSPFTNTDGPIEINDDDLPF